MRRMGYVSGFFAFAMASAGYVSMRAERDMLKQKVDLLEKRADQVQEAVWNGNLQILSCATVPYERAGSGSALKLCESPQAHNQVGSAYLIRRGLIERQSEGKSTVHLNPTSQMWYRATTTFPLQSVRAMNPQELAAFDSLFASAKKQ